MIDNVLDLLWGNGIQPENVVMGFGFYGRSFTMSDPSCFQPDGVCRLRTGGMPGSCSDTAGVLTYQEIASRNSSLDVQTFYHPDTTVLYNVFEGSHTKVIVDCIWSGCQGPFSISQDPECPDGYDYQTFHYNKPEGVSLYREEYVSSVSGKKSNPLMGPFNSALCWPKGRSYSNCNWANDPQSSSDLQYGRPELYCLPQPCKQTQVEIADGLNPPRANAYSGGSYEMSCDGVSLPPNYDPLSGFCFDPPSTWNKDWPVDPDRLYELSFNDPETDKAIWQYDIQYESNDRGPIRADGTVPDGSDAYVFMILNGEEEAIDDNFQKSYTVVRRTVSVPRVKRDILAKNQTVLERVFEHVEETFQVYCKFPPGADECEAVWNGGAEDTIIRLPDHISEGPFARISMMPVGNDYQLPKHHLQHRSLDGIHDNPVYEVKVDYNFHLACQDRGPVQIQVDFTNLLGYWSELTDSEADGNTARRAKRTIPDDGFTMRHFRDRVAKAEESEKSLPKRSGDTILTTVPLEAEPPDPKPDNCLVSRERNIAKRWWGTFTRWLAKLTTVTRSEVGDLPMGWADKINLFKASWGCPGKTWSANLRMDLEAEITMQSTYAYYYSGTFIPPTKPDVFFFFGIQPEAYVGLKMVGNAELRYPTNKKKIVDTLGYPGLAVKGIAAIGPTLDIYGQDSSDIEKHDEILNLGLTEEPKKPHGLDVTPTFEAGVQVNAEIDIILQPEANVGMQIGGGSYTAGRTLISAQITAFMTGILQFIATGTISTSTGRFDYTYGSYFYYQLGFKAKATVLDWANWALKDRLAYAPDPRKYTIYKSSGSIDPQGNRKRMIRLIDQPDSEDDKGQSYANDTLAETALLDPMYLFKRQDDDSMDLVWYTQKTIDGATQGWSIYEESRPVPVSYDRVNWSDDYYRNPRQGNAAEFNGLCYRGDSYATNGWPGSYRYSRCKVDFGAVVTKRSEGDAAGEKDEWEITGVTMLDDDFVVGEDVDWDLLAKLRHLQLPRKTALATLPS
ncbi:hypothetical protein N0V92_003934 [Colletotrichum tropicale]|nr:hypothetical protein N0V92_003934 [Colletotrichum tropicale]